MFSNICVFINLSTVYKIILVSMIFIISFCFFRGKWFSFTYCVMCSKGVLSPLETLSKSRLVWSMLAVPFFHSVVIFRVTQSLRSLTLPPHCPDCVTLPGSRPQVPRLLHRQHEDMTLLAVGWKVSSDPNST